MNILKFCYDIQLVLDKIDCLTYLIFWYQRNYPSMPTAVEPREDSIATLVSMGFDRNAARQALVHARNDVNVATNILLESQSHWFPANISWKRNPTCIEFWGQKSCIHIQSWCSNNFAKSNDWISMLSKSTHQGILDGGLGDFSFDLHLLTSLSNQFQYNYSHTNNFRSLYNCLDHIDNMHSLFEKKKKPEM